tara:strand:- start:51 stop:518 length:468 start_codon:yes stop_codon:yes gene_type:complete
MSYLSNLLPKENIILDVNLTSKKRILDEAGLIFEKSLRISRGKIFKAFIEREKIGSTALGNGIAIPHGRIDKIQRSTAAFIRSLKPVSFDATDDKPVSIFFFLIVPSNANMLHLQILSELSQVFSNGSVLEKIRLSKDPQNIFEIFSDWEKYAEG